MCEGVCSLNVIIEDIWNAGLIKTKNVINVICTTHHLVLCQWS